MDKPKKPISLPKLELADKKQGFLILLVGIVVALIIGGFAAGYGWVTYTWIYWILALGVVVGVLNIFHEEGILFLISGLTLTFMLYVLAGSAPFPVWAVTLLNAVIYLSAPATVIVGLKVLYALAAK